MNIPESEIKVDFARSGGPGGQNVNKVESKAVLHWHVGNSTSFDDKQKQLIREAAGKHLNNDDEIFIDSHEGRSQLNNRERAIEKLNELVEEALKPVKKRIETKPSRSENQKRLTEKKQHSQKKALRQTPTDI